MKFSKWHIAPAEEADIRRLGEAGYPQLVSQVLAARGISTAEEAAASEDAAELAGAPDAPQPVREPASTAPASRRANLWFSFMMIYLEVSILQKRL